jgi:ribonuclease HI
MEKPPIIQCEDDSSMSVIAIRFDGGTSCNKPTKGYGNGYGSYKINDGEVRRLEFNVPMSNNVAEISTLTSAVNALETDRSTTRLHICGDSKIALSWAYKAGNGIAYTSPKHGPHAPMFFKAVMSLYEALRGVREVKTNWEARRTIHRVFGH